MSASGSSGPLVVFVTFQYGVLGPAWYLIASISDLCILPYFETIKISFLPIFRGIQIKVGMFCFI